MDDGNHVMYGSRQLTVLYYGNHAISTVLYRAGNIHDDNDDNERHLPRRRHADFILYSSSAGVINIRCPERYGSIPLIDMQCLAGRGHYRGTCIMTAISMLVWHGRWQAHPSPISGTVSLHITPQHRRSRFSDSVIRLLSSGAPILT